MATVVDICNTALNYLGQAGNLITINPDESSDESELCNRFYPICRDALLEEHPWTFSTRRVALAVKGTDAYGWKYKYSVPSDSMKVISIVREHDKYFDWQQPFIVESDTDGLPVILTDVECAVCRYTWSNTNTATYSEAFCDALAIALAMKLSGAIIKGTTSIGVEDKLLKLYQMALSRAKLFDTQQNRNLFKTSASYLGAEGLYRGYFKHF